jgi:hypothetical protein
MISTQSVGLVIDTGLYAPHLISGRPSPVSSGAISGPSFLLARHPDDSLFREATRLHVHPLTGEELYPHLEEISRLSLTFMEVRSAGK